MIFVSYSHKDFQKVAEAVERIERAVPGIKFWYDYKGIYPDDDYKRKIIQKINECDYLMFFATCNAQESEDVKKEVNFALRKKKPIILAVFEPTALSDEYIFDFPTQEINDFSNEISFTKMVKSLAEHYNLNNIYDQPLTEDDKLPEIYAIHTNCPPVYLPPLHLGANLPALPPEKVDGTVKVDPNITAALIQNRIKWEKFNSCLFECLDARIGMNPIKSFEGFRLTFSLYDHVLGFCTYWSGSEMGTGRVLVSGFNLRIFNSEICLWDVWSIVAYDRKEKLLKLYSYRSLVYLTFKVHPRK